VRRTGLTIGWIVLIAVVIGNQVDWLHRDGLEICGSNTAERLVDTQILSLELLGVNKRIPVYFTGAFRSALMPYFTAPAVAIFGPGQAAFLATHLVFAAILAASVAAIAASLAGGAAALLAAALVLLAPGVITQIRAFNFDFPVAALTMAALAVLLRSDGLRKRGWTIVFGVVAGLAMTAKITAPAWLLPAGLMALVIGWRAEACETGGRVGRPLLGALLAVAAFTAVALPFCWAGLEEIGRAFLHNATRPDSPTWRSVDGAPLWRQLFQAFGVLLPAAVGVGLVFSRRVWDARTAVLWAAALPALVFLLIKPTGMERFGLVPLAALACFAAASIVRAVGRRGWAVAVAVVVSLSVTLVWVDREWFPSGGFNRHPLQLGECFVIDQHDIFVAEMRAALVGKRRPVVVMLSQALRSYSQGALWRFAIREAAPGALAITIDGIHDFHFRHYDIVERALPLADFVAYHAAGAEGSWPEAGGYDNREAWDIGRLENLAARRRIYDEVIVPGRDLFEEFARVESVEWFNGVVHLYRPLRPSDP
jgi:Dolichyl-phosphate-mannose-protein mannosyltransferase